MADSTWPLVDAAPPATRTRRHSALVRVTHWLTTLSVFALLVTGCEIIISHPRFYWGETGNPMMPSLFDIPIPASRPWVNTGYNFTLPDQNGWSRALHFQSAWVLVLTGLVYLLYGLAARHFRRNLVPADLRWRTLRGDFANHLRRPDESEARSYNVLQRLAYLSVIFVLIPLAILTGLAMSPAVASVVPTVVTVFGGQQSARTIHFFVSILLVLFIVVHVVMVYRAGFRNRMRAMITGRAESESKRS